MTLVAGPVSEERPTAASPAPRLRRRRSWPDVLGVGWVVGAAVALLVPILSHGRSFGEFDSLSQFGVLAHHGVVVHNTQAGDQADSINPWMSLAWTQVHQGHLPLWNPYGGLGMPLTFNWQTASFSVPVLVAYLFPVSLSSTISVVLTLVIAGTGAFVLCRVLGLSVVACAFGGTVFELSGPMIGWLGWIHSSAMAWAGWLLAAVILVFRGRHRLRSIAILAVVLAAMIYAGSPEVLVLFGLAIGIFVVLVLVLRATKFEGGGPVRRPALDLLVGTVAGGMLGAPLFLPGLQVAAVSQRGVSGGDPAELLPGNPPLPPHTLTHFLFQGYDGLPIVGNHWFGYTLGYSETAAYFGAIALVLAVVGIAVRRRRPIVAAIAGFSAAMLCIAFVPFVVAALSHAPVVGTVLWQRALLPLALGVAVLSAIGLDSLLRPSEQQQAIRWALGGFTAMAVVIALLWVFGRGHLSAEDASTRSASFVWPAVATVVGFLAVGTIRWSRRPRMEHGGALGARVAGTAGLLLLLCESAFLVSAGAPLWTASDSPYPSTPAETAFRATIGSSLVGFGAPMCFYPPGLGIPPNAHLAYGVREMSIYDPSIPNAYFSSWTALTHRVPGNPNNSSFCPVFTTVDQARLYGVQFVLEPAHSPGPPGSLYQTTIAREDVYRVPNSGPASLVALGPTGAQPGRFVPGTQVSVQTPDPATWHMMVNAQAPSELRLRLTNVPGWHATIDGRPVPLETFNGVMLQMQVPKGHHVVTVTYWPVRFTFGLVLALIAVLGFVTATLVSLAGRSLRNEPVE